MINARSIRNKFLELETFVASEDYHIVGVSESWLNTESRDFLAEYHLPGYSLFSCERKYRSGGGVLLYVKNSLQATLVEKEKINDVDTIFLNLTVHSRKITIGLIYRPPSLDATTDKKLFDQIDAIANSCESIIFGDFNLPVPSWGNPISSHSGHNLYDSLLESALSQHVNEPTRDSNVLDLVFSTNDELISNVVVGPEFSTSDHKIVKFDIDLKIYEKNGSEEIVYVYSKGDYDKLRLILSETDWNEISSCSNIDESWKKFTNILNTAVKSCIPVTKRRSRNNNKPKWWNNEIKLELSNKKRAYSKYQITQNENDKTEYERLRRSTKKLIKQSKKNLEVHIASKIKSNPKEFYSYVRQRKVITSNVGPLLNDNGEHVSNDVDMAEILNEYFASVFTIEDTNGIMETSTASANAAQLNNCEFTEENIIKTLENIKVNKTPGPDRIAPRILKETKHQIWKPLSIIFEKSLNSGKVPRDWKLANITPIEKKGNKSLPCNYRPISLTSIVCKIMETILRNRLVNFLEGNNLIKNSQHGFRNKRSCLTNLLDFYNEVVNIFDETKAVDVIYLDFQKAFDKVPHKRLLNKIKSHGIIGNIHSWLKDWLTERKQRVVLNGKASNWRDVLSGVPQGSVLGPVLFLIYVNDMDEGLTCKISKFADDTKITGRVTSTAEKALLQSDLDCLVNWSKKWQMTYNVEKCKVLHIGSNNNRSNYLMNSTEITKVKEEKDLGIIISNNLKPGKHCTEVVKTANKLIGFIGRTFEFKSEKVILALFNALVRPHLEYCVQFWSPHYRKDIDKLERVQRRATKLIPRLRNMPYEERLKQLNLFSLEKRRMRGDLIEVFKMFQGFDNVNIRDYLDIDRERCTRSNGFKIIGKNFRSEESKHFFFNRIVNVWNSLPTQVVNCNTIERFKTGLDKFMTTNPNLEYFAPR